MRSDVPPSAHQEGLSESLSRPLSILASQCVLSGMEDRKKTWDNLGIDAVISQPNSDPRKSHSPLTSSTKGKPCDWPLNLKITARKRGLDTGKGDPFFCCGHSSLPSFLKARAARWRTPPGPNVGQQRGTEKKPICSSRWPTHCYGAWEVSPTPQTGQLAGDEKGGPSSRDKGPDGDGSCEDLLDLPGQHTPISLHSCPQTPNSHFSAS